MLMGTSFSEGLKRHGIKCDLYTHTFAAENKQKIISGQHADLFAFWGRTDEIVKRRGCKFTNYIKAERAYFEDRHVWAAYGFNGLNGRADFCNKNMPDDRWKKHFNDGRMKDWNTKGDYVLLCLQQKGDKSLEFFNVDYNKIIEKIKSHTDLPIIIRDHPQQKVWKSNGTWKLNYKCAPNDMPIQEAIKNAKVVVSVNSNVGVDAILAGKPTIALDKGSMVWDLAEKDFSRINEEIPEPDRMQWAYNLAYTQWLPDEVKSGDTWEHLKRFYER